MAGRGKGRKSKVNKEQVLKGKFADLGRKNPSSFEERQLRRASWSWCSSVSVSSSCSVILSRRSSLFGRQPPKRQKGGEYFPTSVVGYSRREREQASLRRHDRTWWYNA